MNLRIALYELAATHRLAPEALRRLREIAGLDQEPAAVRYWLPRVVALLGAALGGFGLILWVAANWDDFGRFGRFALLQGTVLVMCAGAVAKPRARLPFALIALLAIGGLFAYFGQTYQTGADPWQLFALWAVLALPLCLAVRSDVLWVPWVLVAMTAITLWINTYAGRSWSPATSDAPVHLLGWAIAFALVFALGPVPRRHTGAGVWSMRVALLLAVSLLTGTGLAGVFASKIALQFPLAVLLLAGTAVWLARPASLDLLGLSAIALGLNALLLCWLARVVLDNIGSNLIGALFVLGVAAAGLLGYSVSLILRLARRDSNGGQEGPGSSGPGAPPTAGTASAPGTEAA